jgi:hypothetical protein
MADKSDCAGFFDFPQAVGPFVNQALQFDDGRMTEIRNCSVVKL